MWQWIQMVTDWTHWHIWRSTIWKNNTFGGTQSGHIDTFSAAYGWDAPGGTSLYKDVHLIYLVYIFS
jgi:hypothetical protein